MEVTALPPHLKMWVSEPNDFMTTNAIRRLLSKYLKKDVKITFMNGSTIEGEIQKIYPNSFSLYDGEDVTRYSSEEIIRIQRISKQPYRLEDS